MSFKCTGSVLQALNIAVWAKRVNSTTTKISLVNGVLSVQDTLSKTRFACTANSVIAQETTMPVELAEAPSTSALMVVVIVRGLLGTNVKPTTTAFPMLASRESASVAD